MTIQQIVAHDKWYYRSEIPLYRKRYNQMNQGYININWRFSWRRIYQFL